MSQTERLQERVKDARDQLQDTVEELRERFSPVEMTQQGVDYLCREGGSAARKTMDVVESHPLAFALMGAGLAWLLFAPAGNAASGQRRPERPAPEPRDEVGGFGDDPYADAERRRETSGSERQAGDERDEDEDSALRRGAREASRVVRETSNSVGAQISHTVQTRPLTVAAAGLAVGVLIAALLPPTEFENRLLGDTRQQIKQRAADSVSAVSERATAAAEHLAETAKQELHANGTEPGTADGAEPSTPAPPSI